MPAAVVLRLRRGRTTTWGCSGSWGRDTAEAEAHLEVVLGGGGGQLGGVQLEAEVPGAGRQREHQGAALQHAVVELQTGNQLWHC